MQSSQDQGPLLSPSVYSEPPEQAAHRYRPLSGFFNGRSVLAGRNRSGQPSNATTPRTPAFFLGHHSNALRMDSPSSMLSMRVGPTAPPSHSSRAGSMASFNGGGLRGLALPARAQVLDYGGNMPFTMLSETHSADALGRTTTSSGQRRRKRSEPRWVPKHSSGKVWFPALALPAARKKFFHTVITGTLLAIILIVCELRLRSFLSFTY